MPTLQKLERERERFTLLINRAKAKLATWENQIEIYSRLQLIEETNKTTLEPAYNEAFNNYMILAWSWYAIENKDSLEAKALKRQLDRAERIKDSLRQPILESDNRINGLQRVIDGADKWRDRWLKQQQLLEGMRDFIDIEIEKILNNPIS